MDKNLLIMDKPEYHTNKITSNNAPPEAFLPKNYSFCSHTSYIAIGSSKHFGEFLEGNSVDVL